MDYIIKTIVYIQTVGPDVAGCAGSSAAPKNQNLGIAKPIFGCAAKPLANRICRNIQMRARLGRSPWPVVARGAIIDAGKAVQAKEIALALNHIRRAARGAHGIKIGQCGRMSRNGNSVQGCD